MSSTTYQGFVSALTTSNLVEVTLTEYTSLVDTDEILPGKFYLISEVDSELYGGTTILINGVTNNNSTIDGHGIFYNPKYDQTISGNGVWNRYINLSVINYTGTTFTIGETVTSDLGGTALFIGGEFLEWVNGDWSGSTYMTGNTSGTIAEIIDSYFVQYNVGDKVIWGGKTWELISNTITGETISTGDNSTFYSGYTTNRPIQPSSITIYSENEIFYDNGSGVLIGGGGGTVNYDTGEWNITTSSGVTSGYSITMDYFTEYVGNSIDKYNLSSIWSPLPFNENDYNLVVDKIEYDYVHDKIVSRKDRFGNEIKGTYESVVYFENLYGNPIKDFQWGNNLDNFGYEIGETTQQLGLMNNIVEYSYFDCLNFLGGYLWSNQLRNYGVFNNNLFYPNDQSFFSENTINNSSIIGNNILSNNCSISELILTNTNFTNNNIFTYTDLPSLLISCELKNSIFSGNTLYNTVLSDNNFWNLSSFISNYFLGSVVSGNTIGLSCTIESNNFVSSEITLNEISNESYILNNTFSDSILSYNNLISDSWISDNILINNSSISQNNLETNCGVFENLFSGCSIQSNNLNSDSKIMNNSGFSDSNLSFNSLFNGSISGNILNDTCSINENEVVNFSEISLNTLQTSGVVSNNVVKNDSYITQNILSSSSTIQHNNLLNGYIYLNTLSGGTIDSNELNIVSEIYQNELVTSDIFKNKFDVESSLFNGVFIGGQFTYNYSKNSIINLLSSCVISGKSINDTNFYDSSINDISENSTVIYDNYPKNVFTNSTGGTRISYYDSSDTLVIGLLNDSILPTLNISAWTATSFYDIDVTVDITLDGGNSVTERGVVWAISGYPTVNDNIVVDGGTGTGSYTNSLTGLTSGATIYFRGYAVNSSGTGYTCQDTYDTVI